MNKWLNILSLLIFSFLLGCSNWALKERCEKTNWFDYSQNVAFQGRYLEEDGFIKDCKGVDRTNAVQLDLGFKQGRDKMCQYDEIFTRAKEGVPVYFQFCDGLEMGRMKALYRDGLVSYCTSPSGYIFGKAGKIYQNLCTPQQEKDFLPGYNKGRKEYLTDLMTGLKAQLAEFKRLEQSYSTTEYALNSEYSSLPNAMDCTNRTVYNESTKQDESKLICEEAGYIRSRRNALWNSLDDVRSRLQNVRSGWNDANGKLAQAQLDFNSVP